MKLMICGDISVTDQSRPIFAAKDARGAFGDVVDLFAKADRVVVNLECALTDSENRINKLGPNLKGPKGTADALKAAGVTDCALSNNHIFDFGKEGMLDTVRELDRCGLGYTGWGENYEDSRKNYFIEHDGVKVGIVNVCEHEYTYATDNRMGARPFDEFETMHDIRMAKAEADYVIVIYHGGKELCRYPSPRLRKACREMVRCGADVVLCQHSHIIGSHETFEGGKILYGQGNFHFSGFYETTTWNEGLIVCFDVTKQGIDWSFEAVKASEGRIRLANDAEKAEVLKGIEERNAELDNGEWYKHWIEFCEKEGSAYYRERMGFNDNSTPAEYQMLAHYIDCEAHLDVIKELFKTYNHTNELE